MENKVQIKVIFCVFGDITFEHKHYKLSNNKTKAILLRRNKKPIVRLLLVVVVLLLLKYEK